jgi:tetratricopeptide (TPR) repeat protein
MICMVLAASAGAFEIEYAEDRPAVLKSCDTMLYAGETPAAVTCYRQLVDTDLDVRIKADASLAMGDYRAANTYFQTAIKQFPEDPALRARWGDLFRLTHQNNEALKLYREALELDSEYRPAMRGLVKIAAEGFSEQANDWLDEILKLEPNDVEAQLLRARLELEDGATDDAEATLANALEIVERDGVTPLEVYALEASLALLRGIDHSGWVERALALNPRYGEIYATPAYFYVITRRYREAVELLQKAVEIEPTLYSAHAELGVNLLRENRVPEATTHLQLAYSGDPFSTQTVNTLRLLDSLENFTFKGHGELEVDGRTVPKVFLRLHKDETEVLTPYVLNLIYDTIDAFSKRYEFELKEPVIVELYPEHDDFAVRTSGLPGIGLLGVTFGYLVAMDSPSGRGPGEFHWGTTLWHEMAHIFTLEATQHLVPRWFSEGVSVHEEWSTGPLPGRHLSLAFFDALRKEQLLPVAELDRGFIRPTYPSQIIVSYMQAGLVCNYIADNWGQASLAAMLREYRDGRDTEGALLAATGISAAEFDRRFAEFLDEEFGAVLASWTQWRAAEEALQTAARAQDWPAVVEAAGQAIEYFPAYVDEGNAYVAKAVAHTELGEPSAALATLNRYFELGGYDPEALYRLARMRRDQSDTAGAVEVLEALLLVAPLQEQLHSDLGDWLRELGRGNDALAEYEALLAMNPHDKASAHFRLAQVYLDLDQPELSREHLLYALEIAPHFREAQDMLLETLR